PILVKDRTFVCLQHVTTEPGPVVWIFAARKIPPISIALIVVEPPVVEAERMDFIPILGAHSGMAQRPSHRDRAIRTPGVINDPHFRRYLLITRFACRRGAGVFQARTITLRRFES